MKDINIIRVEKEALYEMLCCEKNFGGVGIRYQGNGDYELSIHFKENPSTELLARIEGFCSCPWNYEVTGPAYSA